MQRSHVWLFAGTSLAVCQAAAAYAQPEPQTQAQTPAVPQATTPTRKVIRRLRDGGTEEVVVTAQRRSERLQRTPVAVQVLSAVTLQRQAITSDRDLQIAVPGLTVRASQNANQLNYSLRGQTVDTYTSSLPAVLPYVNEVPVGGVGQSAFYDLQSVQVLKGPQGTLFGRNATGGAVLFTTAKPTDQLSGYAIARGGNFGERAFEGAIGGAVIPGKLLVRIAGTYDYRDGYQRNLFYNTELGNREREGVRLSVTARPTDRLTDDFVVDLFQERGNNIVAPVSYVVPVADNVPGNPFVPNNVYIPGLEAFGQEQEKRSPFVVDVDSLEPHRTQKLLISNVTRYKIDDNLTFKNVVGFVSTGIYDAGDLDGTPFGIDGRGTKATGVLGSSESRRQISEEPQLLGTAFNNRLTYVLGAYADSILDQNTANSFIENELGAPVQVNSGINRSQSAAAYTQGTYDTGYYGFKVIGGFRYTVEHITFVRNDDDLFSPVAHPEFLPFFADGRFISPQADTFRKISWTGGIQNQVTSDLLLYITSRHSFRSGGFNFYTPPTPGFASDSGGEFKPELATDIEGGAKYHGSVAGLPVSVNLAIYNQWVTNVQRAYYEAIYDGLAAVTVNVPKAQITGFELDGSFRPLDWLTLGGNVNYTDARFTQNQVPVLGTNGTTTIAAFNTYPDTPKWSGLGYADASFPITDTHNLDLHGDLYYQTMNYFSSTGQSLNPFTRIAPYAVANFRVGFDPASGRGYSIAGVIKNAFDRTYYTGGIGFASIFGLNIHLPAEPQTYMVELGYRF